VPAIPPRFANKSDLHPRLFGGYRKSMVEPRPDVMVDTEEEVEVDAETAAAIDRGLRAADEGRVVSSEEVRKLIPQWISRFSAPNQH